MSVDRDHGIFQIAVPLIKQWLPPSALKNGSWEDSFSKQETILTLSNGSFIEFLTYRQQLDSHAGTSRHAIWFDEEPPEAVFDENLLRLVDTNGKYFMTLTPVEGMTWLYDRLWAPAQIKERSSLKIIQVHSTENPFLPKGAMDVLTEGMSEEDKNARLRGEFSQGRRLIYPDFNEKNIIQPRLPAPEHLLVEAMDYGIRNPTAWLFAFIDHHGDVTIFDEYYSTGITIPEVVDELVRREKRYGKPTYRVGDPSIYNKVGTGTSMGLEYADRGIHIVRGNNDVAGGLARVRTYIGGRELLPKLFVCSNCTNLIKELRNYRFKIRASRIEEMKKENLEEPEKKKDHGADALKYLVASRPQKDFGLPVINHRHDVEESVSSLPMNGPYRERDFGEQEQHNSDLGSIW